MALKKAKCPHCEANLEFDDTKKAIACRQCKNVVLARVATEHLKSHGKMKIASAKNLEREKKRNEISKKRIHGAVALALLIGFGSHNFYLGYLAKAIIQLGIGIAGALTFVFVLIVHVLIADVSDVFLLLLLSSLALGANYLWSVIESTMLICGGINRDGRGRKLLYGCCHLCNEKHLTK
ncbi:MAG: TM2 domain-containing protein [Firmicutes bacterium]|nr:TM2 domain-containing protein [Bacillota bacterium]MCL2255891.1 TM2 domain-containing protein [Bacillota bacterium]